VHPAPVPDEEATARRLIESQRRYYDVRAPDYADAGLPPDRKRPGLLPAGEARRLVAEFGAHGDVLELACGTGGLTRELIRHARTVTAVDGSARMLDLNRQRVGDSRVRYVHADLFEWRPEHRYDAVFFGFWLSHVPPTHFDAFWSMVEACLRPGARAGFVDEDDRGTGNEADVSTTGIPAPRRTLGDGRTFEIVKVFWRPPDLRDRLRALGWHAEVRSVGWTFLYGAARPGGLRSDAEG
jgi:demethylmenaquinone methyltransferase/2-methoxy-6-polyprenyl-1,4-benzoquinol methylase